MEASTERNWHQNAASGWQRVAIRRKRHEFANGSAFPRSRSCKSRGGRKGHYTGRHVRNLPGRCHGETGEREGPDQGFNVDLRVLVCPGGESLGQEKD